MVDWWFDWHPREPIRYRVWHPLAHTENSADFPAPPGEGALGRGPSPGRGRRDRRRSRPDRIRAPDRDRLRRPTHSRPRRRDDRLRLGGDDRTRMRPRAMAHVFLPSGDGVVLRSRFWLGAAIRPYLPAPSPSRPRARSTVTWSASSRCRPNSRGRSRTTAPRSTRTSRRCSPSSTRVSPPEDPTGPVGTQPRFIRSRTSRPIGAGQGREAAGVGERPAGRSRRPARRPRRRRPARPRCGSRCSGEGAPVQRSGTRTWMRLRNITFLTPCATPPTNEQARKNRRRARGREGEAAPWIAAAASPSAATAPAATRRERSRAPSAIPAVHTDRNAP